jgi:hypothetical protein
VVSTKPNSQGEWPDIRKFFPPQQRIPQVEVDERRNVVMVERAPHTTVLFSGQRVFFEPQHFSFCGLHAIHNIFARSIFSFSQALTTAKLAAILSDEPVDEHADHRGNYSCTVVTFLLTSLNCNSERLQVALEDDLFSAQPDQRVLGLIMHANKHYIAYKTQANEIQKIDSLHPGPRFISLEVLQADANSATTVFRISKHIHNESVYHNVLTDLNSELNADPAVMSAELAAYRDFREALRISVSE